MNEVVDSSAVHRVDRGLIVPRCKEHGFSKTSAVISWTRPDARVEGSSPASLRERFTQRRADAECVLRTDQAFEFGGSA